MLRSEALRTGAVGQICSCGSMGPGPRKATQEVSIRRCLCQPPSIRHQPHQPHQRGAPQGQAEEETGLALGNASGAHITASASAPCHGTWGQRLVLPGSTAAGSLREL